MNKLPISRNENIIVQDLNDEVLIYDLTINKAFCLNATAARVYLACDGETTVNELKRKHKFTDDLIFLALDQLKKEGLLETDDSLVSPFNGLSRREAIRKVGLASLVALPVISALVAPTAAMAQSGGMAASTCTSNVCFAAGSNVCAGCENRNISINQFPTSTNGTCSGAASPTQTIPCGATPRSAGNDVRRN